MDTELVNAAIQTPPPGEVAPPSTEEPVSLADHAAQFDPKRPAEPTDTVQAEGTSSQAERPRHRAKSQQASAADVPRIAELTKKLREAERERDEWKSKVSTPPPVEPTKAPILEKPTPAASAKPTWKQFEDEIGTKYDSWAAAQDAYADARDAWKDAQGKQAQSEQAFKASEEKLIQSYVTRAQETAKSVPDFFEKTGAAKAALDAAPELLTIAVITDDKGPEIAYYLATHPETLAELSLLTDGKSVTANSVALLQRRLSSYRLPAAPIASAPVIPPHTPAPRPPNAMRTAPMKTGDDLPAEGHSLAEHRRAFDPKRRR